MNIPTASQTEEFDESVILILFLSFLWAWILTFFLGLIILFTLELYFSYTLDSVISGHLHIGLFVFLYVLFFFKQNKKRALKKLPAEKDVTVVSKKVIKKEKPILKPVYEPAEKHVAAVSKKILKKEEPVYEPLFTTKETTKEELVEKLINPGTWDAPYSLLNKLSESKDVTFEDWHKIALLSSKFHVANSAQCELFKHKQKRDSFYEDIFEIADEAVDSKVRASVQFKIVYSPDCMHTTLYKYAICGETKKIRINCQEKILRKENKPETNEYFSIYAETEKLRSCFLENLITQELALNAS